MVEHGTVDSVTRVQFPSSSPFNRPRNCFGRFIRICPDCQIYPIDKDEKRCEGCDTYNEHLEWF